MKALAWLIVCSIIAVIGLCGYSSAEHPKLLGGLLLILVCCIPFWGFGLLIYWIFKKVKFEFEWRSFRREYYKQHGVYPE